MKPVEVIRPASFIIGASAPNLTEEFAVERT